jgi:hypothetical protein
MQKKTATYSINPKYQGCNVGTKQPPYVRAGKGLFLLDDKLSQKDMAFLYEVMHLNDHIKKAE